ncbi:MAG: class I SAM-dependent methyltransferase [Thaumarchaeota archaeon]|nr:class I SAM-dependent methyltransferase [Nitrososphaerota archaeon]
MASINPIQVLLWAFRRNEKDVINLYSALSQVMHLATKGNMLNFGYWNENTKNPLEAQNKLCRLIGEIAELDSATKVLDVGSGFSAPAVEWKAVYNLLEIICVNTHFQQLKHSVKITDNGDEQLKTSDVQQENKIFLVNSTSTALPIEDHSVDRVIALESAQHFKPLKNFIRESKRVLKQNGLLVLTIPVTIAKPLVLFMKLGILSLTWSSEHYELDYVLSTVKNQGSEILETKRIGTHVYQPLADYYVENRKVIREMILTQYPAYLENILFKSLLRMKKASADGIIDYLIIKCRFPS